MWPQIIASQLGMGCVGIATAGSVIAFGIHTIGQTGFKTKISGSHGPGGGVDLSSTGVGLSGSAGSKLEIEIVIPAKSTVLTDNYKRIHEINSQKNPSVNKFIDDSYMMDIDADTIESYEGYLKYIISDYNEWVETSKLKTFLQVITEYSYSDWDGFTATIVLNILLLFFFSLVIGILFLSLILALISYSSKYSSSTFLARIINLPMFKSKSFKYICAGNFFICIILNLVVIFSLLNWDLQILHILDFSIKEKVVHPLLNTFLYIITPVELIIKFFYNGDFLLYKDFINYLLVSPIAGSSTLASAVLFHFVFISFLILLIAYFMIYVLILIGKEGNKIININLHPLVNICIISFISILAFLLRLELINIIILMINNYPWSV